MSAQQFATVRQARVSGVFRTDHFYVRRDDAGPDVDTLLSSAGVTLSSRQAMIDGLNAGTLTRAQVLRQISESAEVTQKYFNQAFAVMEYFGYLLREPDAFYLDWIQFLDSGASPRAMVTGFVNSLEYRQRFGP